MLFGHFSPTYWTNDAILCISYIVILLHELIYFKISILEIKYVIQE